MTKDIATRTFANHGFNISDSEAQAVVEVFGNANLSGDQEHAVLTEYCKDSLKLQITVAMANANIADEQTQKRRKK